jgi:hypothetical protein
VKGWYVVAREPREGDFHVNVFGPFVSETDARAYALELQQPENNGWEYCEAEYLTSEEAAELSTEEVLWPYDSEETDEEE